MVFGDTPAADEVFMAWALATYVEHLAARGRAIADILLYANAWFGPQPGQDTPGQYPSGGPTSTVLDIWRAAAPSLAFLGPDLYVHDADAAMAQYAIGIQPFFVPECQSQPGRTRPRDRHVWGVRLVGVRARPGEPRRLSSPRRSRSSPASRTEIAAAAREAASLPSFSNPAPMSRPGSIAGVDITARGARALLRRMLLDVGVNIPDTELQVPDETLPQCADRHRRRDATVRADRRGPATTASS